MSRSLSRLYRGWEYGPAEMFEPLALTASNVESLLSSGPERSSLDFKSTCDLSNRKALVEIVKDIAAFAVYGGYLLIGADEHGVPTGELTEQQAKQFDEATLRPKVEQYVKGLTFHTQTFRFDGKWIAVVCVLPHPDGWAVMEREGAYSDANGRTKTVFGVGAVFARHGSSSERWSQQDAHAIRADIRLQEADKARKELSDHFSTLLTAGNAAQATARGPAATLTLDLDPDTLSAAVIEQVRIGDLIPLKLLLNGAPARAFEEATKVDGDVDGVLDRLLSLGGTLVTIDRDQEVSFVIDGLGAIYNRLLDEHGLDRQGLFVSPDAIRLKLVTRAYALGALLVRREKWTLVRRLAAFKPRVHDADYWTNWLVHADVMAARAGLHNDAQRNGAYRSTLLFAQEHIAALPALRPDLLAEDEQILTSLCQFSFLACLVALDTAGEINRDPFLAQFGVFYSARVDPIVARVIEDDGLRAAVFPHDNQALAGALNDIAYNAGRMSQDFHGWSGYSDQQVVRFIQRHSADAAVTR